MPWWWTWSFRSAIVWMLNSLIFYFACCPTPFILPTDSKSHTLSIFSSSIHCDDYEVIFQTLGNSFCIYFLYASMVTIFHPEQSKTGHHLPVIDPFLLSILATPRHNLPSCSYSKVAFFGWLFVSYLPVLTSIYPSSYLVNRMLCLFTLLVTGGPLTCWVWTS